MRWLVPCTKASKSLLQLEGGIRHLGPATERPAMLALLAAPLFDCCNGGRTGVGENALEVGDIVWRVQLDKRRRLDRGDHPGFDLGAVERCPLDFVQLPALAVNGGVRHRHSVMDLSPDLIPNPFARRE